MPIAQEPLKHGGDEEEEEEGLGDETVLFDNLQSQDEDPADEDGDGLKGPLSFVLDDCPFGPGVMNVLKSMTRGEQCEAWLDPKHGPGETTSNPFPSHPNMATMTEEEERESLTTEYVSCRYKNVPNHYHYHNNTQPPLFVAVKRWTDFHDRLLLSP